MSLFMKAQLVTTSPVSKWTNWALLMALGTLVVVVLCERAAYAESDASLFMGYEFLVPLMTFVLNWNRWYAALMSIASGLWCGLAYWLYVGYQDRPWFAVADRVRDDGPSFGWYTFEFDPPYLIVFIVAGLSVVLAVFIKAAAVGERHNKSSNRTPRSGAG